MVITSPPAAEWCAGAGEELEIWSNSAKAWLVAKVKATEPPGDRCQVSYTNPTSGNSMEKWLIVDWGTNVRRVAQSGPGLLAALDPYLTGPAQYLANKDDGAILTGKSSGDPDTGPAKHGEELEIWSVSANAWLGATVKELLPDNCCKVTYVNPKSGGAMEKTLKVDWGKNMRRNSPPPAAQQLSSALPGLFSGLLSAWSSPATTAATAASTVPSQSRVTSPRQPAATTTVSSPPRTDRAHSGARFGNGRDADDDALFHDVAQSESAGDHCAVVRWLLCFGEDGSNKLLHARQWSLHARGCAVLGSGKRQAAGGYPRHPPCWQRCARAVQFTTTNSTPCKCSSGPTPIGHSAWGSCCLSVTHTHTLACGGTARRRRR